MGRDLGYFADGDNNDNPELNKCPDCDCYFEGMYCPLCGKECPDEYKAGNRKPEKRRKTRTSGGSSRVIFVPWYHSWWFITLMFFLEPIIGAILLFTSPHSKKSKIIATAVVVLYAAFIRYGYLFNIGGLIKDYKLMHPGISTDEIVSSAEQISAADYSRYVDVLEGKPVKTELTVVSNLSEYFNDSKRSHYLCASPDGLYIIVRDCRRDKNMRILANDKVTVYGLGAGVTDLYSTEISLSECPVINMYSVGIEK